MIRGLHESCKSNDIKMALLNMNLDILDVRQIMRYERSHDENLKRIHTPLPLFMLAFHPRENINNIIYMQSKV